MGSQLAQTRYRAKIIWWRCIVVAKNEIFLVSEEAFSQLAFKTKAFANGGSFLLENSRTAFLVEIALRFLVMQTILSFLA